MVFRRAAENQPLNKANDNMCPANLLCRSLPPVRLARNSCTMRSTLMKIPSEQWTHLESWHLGSIPSAKTVFKLLKRALCFRHWEQRANSEDSSRNSEAGDILQVVPVSDILPVVVNREVEADARLVAELLPTHCGVGKHSIPVRCVKVTRRFCRSVDRTRSLARHLQEHLHSFAGACKCPRAETTKVRHALCG